MKVYLAGKITSNGWRHTIFKGLRNFNYDNLYNDSYFKKDKPMIVDGCEYVGPYFLSDDHGMFHGEGTHGRGVGKSSEHLMNQDWKIENQSFVVSKCLNWLKEADQVFVWLDSQDAFGTITEIGYAKALNKPIFFALDSKLKGTNFEEDIWFASKMAYELVYTDNAAQAWGIFVGKTKKTEVEKATNTQLEFIVSLSRKAGKIPNKTFDEVSKDLAGKMIAYFQMGKFANEVEPLFHPMTEEQKLTIEKEEPKLKATEVVNQIKEHFKDLPGFKFSTQKHAKYVQKHNAKENSRWTKTVANPKYYSETTYYSENWLTFLIEQIKSEEQ